VTDVQSLATSTLPARAASVVRTKRRLAVVAGLTASLLASGALAWYALGGRSTPRPAGDLVVAVLPFSGPDDASASEGRTTAALIESEIRRLMGDEEGRAFGLTTSQDAVRSGPAARRLAARLHADMAVWGEALSFQTEVQIQPVLTRVREGPTLPRLSPIGLTVGVGSPIETRRRGATWVAEAVVRVAAQEALGRGRAETALRLLQECRPTPDTLRLRAEVLERLGRPEEAAALRLKAEAPAD
jgi:hypothetical protein